MATEVESKLAGEAVYGNENAPVYVVFPDSQQIVIDSTNDSIAIGNTSGTLAEVTAQNALKVDSSHVTQPISGTVTATQGTIPWAVGDNGGSLTVDNAGTFAVQAQQSGTWNINDISGTVSLPTDAATETTLAAILAQMQSNNNLLFNQNNQVLVNYDYDELTRNP